MWTRSGMLREDNMDYKAKLQAYLEKEIQVIRALDLDSINQVMNLLENARVEEHKIFICGNGGSAATASHFCCDFNKEVSEKQDKKYNFECLSDNVPTMMAIANDISYDEVFIDFDDCLLIDKKYFNLDAIKFIYQCKNRGINEQ